MAGTRAVYDDEHPRCSNTYPDGNQCPTRSVRFGTYCGTCLRKNNPRVQRKEVERRIEKESRKLVNDLMKQNNVEIEMDDLDLDLNPFDALLEIAQEQLVWKEICKAKLAKLEADEWRWDGDRAGEQLRSEVVLYERAIERATNTLAKIARLGIEDRLSKVAQRQQAVMEQAIVRTFADCGLSLEMQAKARTRMIMHLRSS